MNINKDEYAVAINKIRNGELEQYEVNKETFLTFREVLMAQPDKEKFRGEAKKGGEIVYTYVIE